MSQVGSGLVLSHRGGGGGVGDDMWSQLNNQNKLFTVLSTPVGGSAKSAVRISERHL